MMLQLLNSREFDLAAKLQFPVCLEIETLVNGFWEKEECMKHFVTLELDFPSLHSVRDGQAP